MLGIGAPRGRHRADCGMAVWPVTALADMRSWPPAGLVRGAILLPVVGPELQTGRKIRRAIT